MRKTIAKATNYFYEHINGILSKGLHTAIPKDVLEKEGLHVDELNRYFYTKQGPFGLIHFLGIKKPI
jgi:hypothetical protein